MTLRYKTHTAVGLTIVALVIALYEIAQHIVMGGFLELEKRNTQLNVERALAAVSEELSNLESDLGDWAPWDDSYEFITNGNQDFIDRNCPVATYENLDLSLMLFIHSSGRIVYSQGYDTESDELIHVPQGSLDYIAANDTLLRHASTESRIAGLVMLPEGPMLVASQPIVTSDFEGPIRGTLIMGRFLDAGLLRGMATRTHLQLDLHSYSESHHLPECETTHVALSDGRDPIVKVQSEYTVAGYGLIRDLYGEPVLVLRAQLPRSIYGQGRASLNYFFALLLIMGITCWAMISILLEKQVIRRVALLANHVRNVGRSNDLAARLPVRGNDEISTLTGEVNRMLAAIERYWGALEAGNTALQEEIREREYTNNALRGSETKYRTYIENAPIGVYVVDSRGVFVESNEVGCRLVGYTRVELFARSMCDILMPDAKECAEQHLGKLVETGRCSGEFDTQNKNGEQVVLAINAAQVAPDRYLVFAVDVTEHRRIQEALRESEERFRQVAESAGEWIWEVDAQGLFTFSNSIVEKVLGYTPQEVVGIMHFYDLFAPDVRDALKEAAFSAFARRETIRQLVNPNIHKSGSIVILETNGVPILDEKGYLLGYRGADMDITLRQRMENELRKSQERLEEAQAIGKIGSWERDLDSGQVFWSAQMYRLYELDPRSLPPPLDGELLSSGPADADKLRDAILQAVERGEKSEMDVQVTLPSGDSAWHHGVILPVKDESGRVARLTGTVQDITEQKRAEETLRVFAESRKELERIVSLSPAIVFLWRAAEGWPVEYVSDNIRLTGYSPEELYSGRVPYASIIYPDDLERVAAEVMEYSKDSNRDSFTQEYRIVTRSGEVLWIDDWTWIRRNEKGEITHYEGIILDVSNRKGAESALRTSLIHLSNAMRLAKMGYWEYDVLKNFFTFSDEFYALFRTTAEEQGGYTMSPADYAGRFVYPEDLPVVADETRKAIETTDPNFFRQLEHRIIYADGKTGHIAVRFQIVKDREGRTIRTYGMNQDITERKQAEQEKERLESQLRQAQKMEAIGTLAGGIAHDFNNILVPILIYTEMTCRSLPAESPNREDLEHVIQAANRAKDLVRQILTFSRQAEQERMPVGFQFVVKEALKLMRASLPTTIGIEEHIDVNCPEVLADPSQLHQVLMNLCTNAAHALRDEGGILEVRLEPVEVDETLRQKLPRLLPGTHVCLTIRDSGKGMDSRTLERIFEPFFTTKAPGEGTGLGLSMVHGIITGHGGEIAAESTPYKGSTFRVYLPIAKATSPRPPATASQTSQGSERILLVDDDPEIARAAERALQQSGYRVTTFTSSPEALDAFRAQPAEFDLVITDQTMPHLTGDRLVKELLAIRPDLPIVLTTGYSETVTVDNYRKLGVREFAMKPLISSELNSAVRRALDGIIESAS
ncbi:PAS domain S-box protein [bacterium]|nr:PAS domain S-box protein [bacterium]